MRTRKDIGLGCSFEPARWRAANARFSLIVLAMIFLAVTAVAARGTDQVMTTYQSVTIGSSTPLWIAKDAGFFERQGLDVKIVFVEGSPRTMQTLIAGEAQIVESTGPATLNARAADACNGFPAKRVGMGHRPIADSTRCPGVRFRRVDALLLAV